VYEHGNYKTYYGYRHAGAATALGSESDARLVALVDRWGMGMFVGKEVLDIGCNSGRVSFDVAHSFGAKRVVGIDIDASLVEVADAQRMALSRRSCRRSATSDSCGSRASMGADNSVEFRAEDILASPLRRPPDMKPERFDVVLCLSLTKWVHFSHGDDGIRRLFKRCLKRLKIGGLLVLEPQGWESYKKKRHLTREIRQTVAGIQMRPEAFDEYLLGLGLERVGDVVPPAVASKGFKRLLRIYRRPAAGPAETAGADEPVCSEGRQGQEEDQEPGVPRRHRKRKQERLPEDLQSYSTRSKKKIRTDCAQCIHDEHVTAPQVAGDGLVDDAAAGAD